MPKPNLPEPLEKLEREIIEALLHGHREWRPDLPFPESYSDMQGAVRGLLCRFDVTPRINLQTSELRLRVGTLLQLHWKDLTPAQLDAIEAICNRGEGAPCDGRHRHPKRSCPQGCWDRYNAGESTYPEKDATDPRVEAWRALTREEFAALIGTYEAQAYDHGYCEGCASYDDEGLSGAKRTAERAKSRAKATGAALLAAFDALAAERDEWKRRAEEAADSKALAYRTIARLKTERDEQRSRADKAEAERDAALAKLNDWRFARWRELPEAERKVAGDLLNQFGHLAKDGPHKEKARLYWWAMDCLEALGEK